MTRARASARATPLTAGDKAYARTFTRLQVAAAVWTLWKRRSQEKGWDQQWLADRLGRDKSRVSRLLNSPGNWTMDTVADLIEAMGARLCDIELVPYEEIVDAPRRPAPPSIAHLVRPPAATRRAAG